MPSPRKKENPGGSTPGVSTPPRGPPHVFPKRSSPPPSFRDFAHRVARSSPNPQPETSPLPSLHPRAWLLKPISPGALLPPPPFRFANLCLAVSFLQKQLLCPTWACIQHDWVRPPPDLPIMGLATRGTKPPLGPSTPFRKQRGFSTSLAPNWGRHSSFSNLDSLQHPCKTGQLADDLIAYDIA